MNELVKNENHVPNVSPDVAALLAQAAENQSAAETSTIPFISPKGKKFTLGEEKLGTSLSVVILADVFDHAWYDKAYDADVISPPACFAIGKDISTMAPNPISPMPQAALCSECPMNEFGSKGKGKACRNGRRLLVAAVTDGIPDLGNVAIINISPTALKGYARYSKSLATVKKLPTWAVITKLGFDEDAAYPQIVASYESLLDGPHINQIAARLVEFAEAVAVPYDVSGFVEGEAPAEAPKKSKMS
jgi:hypothetical protein